MEPLVIRDATSDDADAIAGVHVRSWQAAYRGILPDELLDGLSVKDRASNWRDWIAQGTLVVLGLRSESMVGFCAVSGTEVGALYVEPQHERTGVGSALLARALDRLHASGAEHATLWVFEANAGARAFYERHGFQLDGATDEHRPGAPEIRLRTSLASSAVFRALNQEF